MTNKRSYHVVFLLFMICMITPKTYGQIDTLGKSKNDTIFRERNIRMSDLENQTLQIIKKYVNVQARDKACKLITKDLLKLLNGWFGAGILKGKEQEEAYMVRVGMGKMYKENTMMDVIVIEIGLAFDQPYHFLFRRITYPIKPNFQLPGKEPYQKNDFNFTDVKS